MKSDVVMAGSPNMAAPLATSLAEVEGVYRVDGAVPRRAHPLQVVHLTGGAARAGGYRGHHPRRPLHWGAGGQDGVFTLCVDVPHRPRPAAHQTGLKHVGRCCVGQRRAARAAPPVMTLPPVQHPAHDAPHPIVETVKLVVPGLMEVGEVVWPSLSHVRQPGYLGQQVALSHHHVRSRVRAGGGLRVAVGAGVERLGQSQVRAHHYHHVWPTIHLQGHLRAVEVPTLVESVRAVSSCRESHGRVLHVGYTGAQECGRLGHMWPVGGVHGAHPTRSSLAYSYLTRETLASSGHS